MGAVILLVDPNRINGELLARHAKLHAGHEVLAAQNVSQALKILQEQAVDVVITEVAFRSTVDRRSGYDLCRLVKDTHPNLPVIFFTANPLQESRRQAQESGADAYLMKPCRLPELFKTIEDQLQALSQHIDENYLQFEQELEQFLMDHELLDDGFSEPDRDFLKSIGITL